MTRGKRAHTVTKAELVDRLATAANVPRFDISNDVSLLQLLGHAIHYGLVTKEEVAETVPRNETTLPCYLFTVILDKNDRERLDEYVDVSSEAFRRGTLILNRIAQRMCGPRLPGGKVASFDVPVCRPRFEEGPHLQAMKQFVALFDHTHGIEDCSLKHAFMPGRYTDLNVHVANALATDLFPTSASWEVAKDVMIDGCSTGWDNAINRMMTRFYGNVKVQAMKNVRGAIAGYMNVVPLLSPYAREVLVDSTLHRLRPLVVHNDDWEMAMAFRLPLTTEHDFFMPKDADWSNDVFLIHLFLTRFGVKERSYLPVGSMGRQYTYLDGKIASYLLEGAKQRSAEFNQKVALAKLLATPGYEEKERARIAKKRVKEDEKRSKMRKNTSQSDKEIARRAKFDKTESLDIAKLSPDNMKVPNTPTLGDLIGVTPEEFNDRRKEIIKDIRKRNTEKATSKAFLTENKRKRFKKAAKHRKRVGYGKMDTETRFDSLETDSFGLRLILKTRVDVNKFIAPITSPVAKVPAALCDKKPKKERISKKEQQIRAMNASEEPQSTDPALKNGIVVGIDEGRAKLLTTAILKKRATVNKAVSEESKSPSELSEPNRRIITEPQDNCDYEKDEWKTTTLTRNRYNAYTKLKIRRKWEAERIQATPALRTVYDAMSLGSLHSCDPDAWDRRLSTEVEHRDILRADLFGDKERERWRMIAFRKKKACLDRSLGDFIALALHGETKDRPLVVGIGDAAFPANGPRGEIAVPTSKLAAAYKRAFARVRRTGRRVAVFPISENYTTKTCCDCGSVTEPPSVTRKWKTREGLEMKANGESCRLRCCKICTPIGKLRDRDVQAARNMHRATVALINGRARPAHLCRAAHMIVEPVTVAGPSNG